MSSGRMPDEFRRISDKSSINDKLDELVENHNPPKTYFAMAILATLFCFPITGIVAICYSTQVSTFCRINNFTAANYAAKKAKLWCILSPITVIAFIALIYVLQLLEIADFENFPNGFLAPFLPMSEPN